MLIRSSNIFDLPNLSIGTLHCFVAKSGLTLAEGKLAQLSKTMAVIPGNANIAHAVHEDLINCDRFITGF